MTGAGACCCPVQKAVNVDLATRAHIDLSIGDHRNRELDRWSRVVPGGVLIAAIKFLATLVALNAYRIEDPFEL